ncbi:MAG: phosphoribosyl-AMP cyclohydrolase [Desulfobacterales bacterium]|nr:phosphoribosyl-AMP cyclohydrolase [Desulfobacterales bacterium]
MGRLNFAKAADGLLPAIVQDHRSNQVLMLAYINEEAWHRTLETGKAHYWSRSRNKLWLKGETSGHIQLIREILVDCDQDTVIYRVEQLGGAACHTGHRSCFFRRVEGDGLKETDGLVFDPREVYSK